MWNANWLEMSIGFNKPTEPLMAEITAGTFHMPYSCQQGGEMVILIIL